MRRPRSRFRPTPSRSCKPPKASPLQRAGERRRRRPASPLAPVRTFIVYLLAIVAAVTCTFGNLAAYGQTNIKRLLAYSTIAHAGYMMMAVAAAVQLAGTNAVGAREAVAALVFYLAVYVFMNLGAFAIVAFLRGAIGSEEIADYAGLIRSVPAAAVALGGDSGQPDRHPADGRLHRQVCDLRVAGRCRRAGDDGAVGDRRLQHRDLADLLPPRGEDRVASIPSRKIAGRSRSACLPTAYVLVLAIPVLYYGLLPDRILDIAHQATQQLFM